MFTNSALYSWIKKNQHVLILALIYVIGLFLFAILLKITGPRVGSDDTVFPVQIQPYSTVWEWLSYRYSSWSGRIFPESFVYIFNHMPLRFWKIISFLLYAVLSFVIFCYYRLLSNKQSPRKDYMMLTLALTLPLLMDTGAFFDGVLWITGSMNYFWILTFGLVALYPVIYYTVKNKPPYWAITLLGLVSTIVAASSQEQVGIVLLVLTLILSCFRLIINIKSQVKKIPLYSLLFTLLVCACFLIGILAPGNGLRLKIETLQWLPDFYTTPLIERLNYSYRWLLDALINHMGLLLAGSWILLVALFVKKQDKDKLDYILMFLLVIIAFFTLSKGYGQLSYWFEFYAVWKPQGINKFSEIMLIPWSLALLVTITAPIILYRSNLKGYTLTILYCAVIASTTLITLSPTLYASGQRTLYVPSMIMMIILYILFEDILSKYKKYWLMIIGLVLCLAASQYILLVFKLVA